MFLLVLDLQNVNITLRILFRPNEKKLPWIYANIGQDYDEKILPSITTEVLKAVVVSSRHSNNWDHEYDVWIGTI